MDVSNWISVASCVVAFLALVASISSHRDKKEREELKDKHQHLMNLLMEVKQTADKNYAQAMAECASNRARLAKMELDFTKELRNYPTRSELDKSLEQALDPVMEHIRDAKTVMDEILRSGLLAGMRLRVGSNLPPGP